MMNDAKKVDEICKRRENPGRHLKVNFRSSFGAWLKVILQTNGFYLNLNFYTKSFQGLIYYFDEIETFDFLIKLFLHGYHIKQFQRKRNKTLSIW